MKAGEHEMVLVINRHRLLTSHPEDVLGFVRDMEAASHMRFTGIANNSNLGHETTCESFLQSIPYAQRVSELTGLPVLMHCLREDLAAQLVEPVPGLFPVLPGHGQFHPAGSSGCVPAVGGPGGFL